MAGRAAYWRELIQRQGRSGLSIVEFCERQRISTASFYVWRKKLRFLQREREPGQPLPERQRAQPQGPLFLPVSVATEERHSGRGAVIEIEQADGTLIRVFEGARRETLVEVLAALGTQS